MATKSGHPPTRDPHGWRYACHVAVGLMLTALATRTWLVQGLIVPVMVSAGSMAETYRGPHREVTCGACGFRFACGLDRPPRGGSARCPNCGARENDFAALADLPGDRMLIDRTAFLFRPPRRWEPIVFRCPEKPGHYCVKRVVGLPGESVEIRDGDVFIDGRIARKTLAEARTMAQLVHDADFPPPDNRPDAPRWQSQTADSRWRQVLPGTFSYESSQDIRAAGEQRAESGERRARQRCRVWFNALALSGSPLSACRPPDWLVFHSSNGEPLTDNYSYNQSLSRQLNPIHDLGFSCQLTWRGPGQLALRASDGRERFEIRLSPAVGRLDLLHNGQPAQSITLPTLAADEAKLELLLVDRQVLLGWKGRTLLAYPYQPDPANRPPCARPLAIGAAGLEVEVTHLRVWRDIYYTDPGGYFRWGLDRPYRLAEDAFFVLGDNSPLSLDSRALPAAGIPGKLMVGKPLPLRGN